MPITRLLVCVEHEQTVAATQWAITHNIGTTAPAVDVWIDLGNGYEKVIPWRVEVVNDKSIIIHFTQPYVGRAKVY